MHFSPEELAKFRNVAEKACRMGGEVLLDWAGRFNVKAKNPGDFVTEADFASQKIIREYIAATFPEHNFIGEEDDEARSDWVAGKLCWVVDPLDGTRNYIHGLNSYSVSVGLVQCGENGEADQPIAGAVFDPVVEECFSAAKGCGATLNGSPIQSSGRTDMRDALVVCSFSPRVHQSSPEITRFLNILFRTGSLRRLGSAALNLCYVACGRVDAYWATAVSAWDVAAGAIVLQEGGGGLIQIDGGAFDLRDPKFLGFCSPEMRESMLPWLQAETVVDCQ